MTIHNNLLIGQTVLFFNQILLRINLAKITLILNNNSNNNFKIQIIAESSAAITILIFIKINKIYNSYNNSL